MRCPFCGATDTKVVDSRLSGDSDQVRRRRECMECEERFTTYETAEVNLPRVIKSRGNREPFSEQKLQAGFQKALEKKTGECRGHRCGSSPNQTQGTGGR